VELALGDDGGSASPRGPPFLRVGNGSGEVLISSAGTIGRIDATVALGLTGVSLSGSFGVVFNTTAQAGAGTLADVPGGPYFRVSGTGATLSLLGQTLSGDFSVERRTATDGAVSTHLVASNVSLSIGSGATPFLVLDQGQGDLVVSSAGIAGSLAAHVGVNNVPRFALTASVAIALDTAGASPYLRVDATGVSLAVLGQTLSGDFSFAQNGGTVTVTAANLALSLVAGGRTVIALTNGSGNLALTAAGIAGSISGTVALDVPGVAFGGSLTLELDTTAATPYLRFAATGASLAVAGQTLPGDFSFAKSGGEVELSAATA
jgi:hypothetical protein